MADPLVVKRWAVKDEAGRVVVVILAPSREAAIERFCAPALNPDAYFGAGGGWTCEEAVDV